MCEMSENRLSEACEMAAVPSSLVSAGNKNAGRGDMSQQPESRKVRSLQQELQLMLDNTREPFMIINRDFEIISFNRAMNNHVEQFLGATLQKGQSVFSMIRPWRQDAFKKVLPGVFAGSHVEMERPCQASDGTTFIYMDYIRPAYNEQGEITGAILSSQDITAGRKAEEVLKISEERWKFALEGSYQGVWEWNIQTNEVFYSKRWKELLGFSEDENASSLADWETLLHPEDRDKVYADIDKHLQAEDPYYENIYRLRCKDNSYKWILARGIIVAKNDDGSPARMIGTHTDITALKHAEQTIAESEQRLLKSQKIARLGNWEMDMLLDRIKFSPTVFDIYEMQQGDIELKGGVIFNTIHPDDRKMVKAVWKQVVAGKETLNFTTRIVLLNGRIKYVQVLGEIARDAVTGYPVYITGTVQDITERKEAENELAREKINQQRKITEATIQAQEVERTELGKELHDNINQILSTTKLYIDMAINDPEIREELLNKSYQNITKAIEEIRNLSKSLVPPSLGDIGLKEALKELISLLPAKGKLNVSLRANGLYRAVIPDTIKLMVFRIVQEQLNNIVKHSRATKAEIKLSISKKMLNIIITDDGVGFDSSKKKRGIGLSNISSRAALHKGQVEIITSPNDGCTLKVIIPLQKSKV
jgi:PAS domain S-box-containing protein